jgi:hypothetical protein
MSNTTIETPDWLSEMGMILEELNEGVVVVDDFSDFASNPLKNMVGPCGLEPQISNRVKVARLGFTTTYKTRGDCQSSRKSYKTPYSVGWIVGWKKSQRHAQSCPIEAGFQTPA